MEGGFSQFKFRRGKGYRVFHMFGHVVLLCLFSEYKEEIPREELKSSFIQAIKNVSAGKLQDNLNENFDKNLKRLEK